MGIAGFFLRTVKNMASLSGVSLMQNRRVEIKVVDGFKIRKDAMEP